MIPLKIKQRVVGAAAITAVIAVSAVMTTWGTATSAPRFATTHATPSATRAHVLDHYDYKATVIRYAPNGEVLTRQTFRAGTKSQIMAKALNANGTGGQSDCFGSGKITVTKTGRSILGSSLYHVKVWTERGYDCILHRVYVRDQGRSMASDDQLWNAEGWIGGASQYFEWQNGWPKSGYLRMGKAKFSGPCITINTTCYAYPMAKLKTHANGTYWWETAG